MRGLVLGGLVVLSLAFVGVAAANEPPLAEAGLDQDGAVNRTVHLDAGGSLDPDGSIAGYEWTIESPDGSITTPNCRTCAQTWFVPRQPGRYNVTVRVTDEGGASREDTLFVDVGARQTTGTGGSNGGGGNNAAGLGQFAAGGSAGGSALRFDAVARESDGQLYLQNHGDGSDDFVFRNTQGENVRISDERWSQAANENGQVPYEEFAHRFEQAGLARNDVEAAMTEGCGGGFACASVATQSSGNPEDSNPGEGVLDDETRSSLEVPCHSCSTGGGGGGPGGVDGGSSGDSGGLLPNIGDVNIFVGGNNSNDDGSNDDSGGGGAGFDFDFGSIDIDI